MYKLFCFLPYLILFLIIPFTTVQNMIRKNCIRWQKWNLKALPWLWWVSASGKEEDHRGRHPPSSSQQFSHLADCLSMRPTWELICAGSNCSLWQEYLQADLFQQVYLEEFHFSLFFFLTQSAFQVSWLCKYYMSSLQKKASVHSSFSSRLKLCSPECLQSSNSEITMKTWWPRAWHLTDGDL